MADTVQSNGQQSQTKIDNLRLDEDEIEGEQEQDQPTLELPNLEAQISNKQLVNKQDLKLDLNELQPQQQQLEPQTELENGQNNPITVQLVLDNHLSQPQIDLEEVEEEESQKSDSLLTDVVNTLSNVIVTDEVSNTTQEEDLSKISAKDRMLLSGDNNLLFTQTVSISPCLTPNEERFQFGPTFAQNPVGNNRDSLAEFENLENLMETLENAQNCPKVENGHRMQPESPSVADIPEEQESYSEFLHHNRIETDKNFGEKYRETLERSKEEAGPQKYREMDTETVPEKIVQSLKSQFSTPTQKKVENHCDSVEIRRISKSLDINKRISKFEANGHDSEYYSETTTTVEERIVSGTETKVKKQKKKSRKEEKENISVKGSFSKFDALQKKNQVIEQSNGDPLCKKCGSAVFQMEQILAARAVWHKNCFRCSDCQKPLSVDTYESNEGLLYCKPHFKALFAPKAVVDDEPNQRKQRRNELIIRENQPEELPPDVVRASQVPDLGLEELQNLDVKKRFEMFEHYSENREENEERVVDKSVKKSPSILSKLARFQQHGNTGTRGVVLSDDEHAPSDDEEDQDVEDEEEIEEGDDPELVRARRLAKKAQKQQIFHFQEMSDVKNRWEKMGTNDDEDLRKKEGRKQEIQSIRSRLFMGKREKMADMYQQAVQDSAEGKIKKNITDELSSGDFDAKAIKERFERGEVGKNNDKVDGNAEDEVYESEMSKNSRTLFLELDANSTKAPQLSPMAAPPSRTENRKAREVFLAKIAPENRIRSVDETEDGSAEIRTADIQERFKFFENFKPDERPTKQFRMTPPRDDDSSRKQEVEEVQQQEETIDEGFIMAEKAHTATKMLNKFRQMEENLQRPQENYAPKPLKQFTPPPTPPPHESSSEEEGSDDEDAVDQGKSNGDPGVDLTDRAKRLREKFEKWETAEKIREKERESFMVIQDDEDNQSQIESTKSLRARFENLNDSTAKENRPNQPKIKVNRFLDQADRDMCELCSTRVYPMEKVSVHGKIFHKNCFKCTECQCQLRMDSYTYNRGQLYCNPHFKRLFISKGNYEFGLDGKKWGHAHHDTTTPTMA